MSGPDALPGGSLLFTRPGRTAFTDIVPEYGGVSQPDSSSGRPARAALVWAFAAVYLIWGSTYLAIRIAIETLPPFFMAAVRFLLAGAILMTWARWRGADWPTRKEWRNTAVVGFMLLTVGNGAVVWAEQWVASGLAALLIATTPIWIVLVDWVFGDGVRPGPWLVLGLVWGLMGVGLLVSGQGMGLSTPQERIGAIVVLAGSFSWAAGSIFARDAAMPSSPVVATAAEMLVGGALLMVVAGISGELGHLDLSHVSMRSALALAYLIVFGALIAFSAYIWLLKVAPAAQVSTYAYVNPVVALFLGWAVLSEPITRRTILAAAVILSAVMLINARVRARRSVSSRTT